MTAPIQTRTEHRRGGLILGLGIGGFIIGILGLIAFFMGKSVKKEIANGAPYQWEGSKARLGMILGLVGFLLNFVGGLILNATVLAANR